jgi:hypothetical protein
VVESGLSIPHGPRVLRRVTAIVSTRVRSTAIDGVNSGVLETFVDRGQLRKLAEPTVLPRGKRTPGLKIGHPRQLAAMHSLVRFAYIAAGGAFTTADLYAPALDAPGQTEA